MTFIRAISDIRRQKRQDEQALTNCFKVARSCADMALQVDPVWADVARAQLAQGKRLYPAMYTKNNLDCWSASVSRAHGQAKWGKLKVK